MTIRKTALIIALAALAGGSVMPTMAEASHRKVDRLQKKVEQLRGDNDRLRRENARCLSPEEAERIADQLDVAREQIKALYALAEDYRQALVDVTNADTLESAVAIARAALDRDGGS